jgi:hypothetical protein
MKVGSSASVNALEQDGGRHSKSFRQFGDGTHAWLALCALDAGYMRHVEVGSVGQSLLTKPVDYARTSEIRCEDWEGIGHSPTIPGLSQLC